MLYEIVVDLDKRDVRTIEVQDPALFGKALAVKRIIEADEPEKTVYLTGYAPLIASGLGFAGKLNVYGLSLLGGNLQGSRSGGLISTYLTRLGVAGIKITGETPRPGLLFLDQEGRPSLIDLADYGGPIQGTFDLAQRLYRRHGPALGLALTDPSTTAFLYNAVVTNTRPGGRPDRAAARGTTIFGRNGLAAVAVARSPRPLHQFDYDRRAALEAIRKIHKLRWSINLSGDDNEDRPVLGGTYGAAAKTRFDLGQSLTNLFRGADVPDEFYDSLLPENIAREQLELARESGLKIERRSCLPGCPNRCVQSILVRDEKGSIRAVKSGEWETCQGLINLGLFQELMPLAAEVLEHSNDRAYDHIEALVALAALALATESGRDTGVRYGDRESILSALRQAVEGRTDLGRLLRRGAAAVEQYYGLERHFTVGGHALPLHNGRALLQTGIGMSWTYGRHGESCSGPGRQNFLGQPYDPADHGLTPETHVLNTLHGIIMYGAVDEQGTCFFVGPNVETLVGLEMILEAMNLPADPRRLVQTSAGTLLDIFRFNEGRGIHLQPLPRIFYEVATRGHGQSPDQAVTFNVPFEIIRDYGLKVLRDVAGGAVTIPDSVLNSARARYDQV
ncbi:MAG: aldehyde ferredoxin oxidoreductase N-terminal domain-containing protein [Thermodesulfobacteriota bacterium]